MIVNNARTNSPGKCRYKKDIRGNYKSNNSRYNNRWKEEGKKIEQMGWTVRERASRLPSIYRMMEDNVSYSQFNNPLI